MIGSVTRDQAKGALVGEPRARDPAKDLAEAEAELARTNVRGRKEFFDLRKRWSKAILIWISVLIGFNALITLAVGIGCLNFQNYEWFITAVTVETFLQVVGLGYVAVRYLFSDGAG